MSDNEKKQEQMYSRAAVHALIKKTRADLKAAHETELASRDAVIDELRGELAALRDGGSEVVHNNRPRQKRNALWQQQLAALQEAASQRELKTWGQNAVGNYLRDKGIGCNNKTAADLVAMLVDDGYLARKGNGKAVYPPERKAA